MRKRDVQHAGWPRIAWCGYGLLFMALLLVTSRGVDAAGDGESMLTGNELLANCDPGSKAESPPAYCLQFVGGLVETLAGLQAMAPENEQIFCLDPEQIPLESVTRTVTGWLQDHSQRLEEPAFLLVSEALGDNYPCNANRPEDNR